MANNNAVRITFSFLRVSYKKQAATLAVCKRRRIKSQTAQCCLQKVSEP